MGDDKADFHYLWMVALDAKKLELTEKQNSLGTLNSINHAYLHISALFANALEVSKVYSFS